MKTIKRILLGTILIHTLLCALLLIQTNIVVAYNVEDPVDWGKPLYGVREIWPAGHTNRICGSLQQLLNSSVLGSNEQEEIFRNIYQRQCTEFGISSRNLDIYHAPTNWNYVTSNGETCENIQDQQIKFMYDDKLVIDAKIEVYKQECLDYKAPTAIDFTTRNKEIKLSAPIPIEGGGVVEASNKSYLFVYMVKMYRYVLGIAGIIAVGELVLAGFQVALSAGDSSRAENGKKRIVQTLEGLGILFTSAIILHTVNPVGYNFDEKVDFLSEMSNEELLYYAEEGYLDGDFILKADDMASAMNWWSSKAANSFRQPYDPYIVKMDSNFRFNNSTPNPKYDATQYENTINTKRIKNAVALMLSGDPEKANIAKIWEIYEDYQNDQRLDPDTILCRYRDKISQSYCGIKEDALESLGKVAAKVKEITGQKLYIQTSSFRTYPKQVYFYYCMQTNNCGKSYNAAYPGTSRHGEGKALDVNLEKNLGFGVGPWEQIFNRNYDSMSDDEKRKRRDVLAIRQAFYITGEGQWGRACQAGKDEWWHYNWYGSDADHPFDCSADLTNSKIKPTVDAVFEATQTIPRS